MTASSCGACVRDTAFRNTGAVSGENKNQYIFTSEWMILAEIMGTERVIGSKINVQYGSIQKSDKSVN